MGLRVWVWLLSLSILWGGSFFFAKVAIGELGPLTVAFGRVALAAFALNLVLAFTAKGLFRRDAPWAAYFVMGFLNNALPFSLIFWGQTQIASGLASILNATTPLFTLVIAHVLTRDEKIGSAKIAALVSGLAGVALLVGPDVLARTPACGAKWRAWAPHSPTPSPASMAAASRSWMWHRCRPQPARSRRAPC